MALLAPTLAAAVLAVAAFFVGRALPSPAQRSASHAVPVHFKRLTFSRGLEVQPSLSSDGRSFVYVSSADGEQSDIYLQRVGGENATNLTPDSLEDDWSPDGKELVVATEGLTDPSARLSRSQLWRIDVMTGAKKQIAMKEDGVQPNWSPHGTRIAFWGLPEGSGLEQITSTEGNSPANPLPSPDGRTLAVYGFGKIEESCGLVDLTAPLPQHSLTYLPLFGQDPRILRQLLVA